MSDYFLGEIRLFPYNNVPHGWAPCQGQSLQVTQYQALFALIGTTYGGNGIQTFNLPDLRGRTPFGANATAQGAKGGSEQVSLTLANLPPHSHNVLVNSGAGTKGAESGNFLAANAKGGAAPFNVYAPPNPPVALNNATVTTAGNGAAHENRQPSLVLAYCIALSGLFPSRD